MTGGVWCVIVHGIVYIILAGADNSGIMLGARKFVIPVAAGQWHQEDDLTVHRQPRYHFRAVIQISVDQVHARSLAYHLQDVVACDGRGVGEAFRLGLRAAWYPDATARDCSRAADMLAFFKAKHLKASLGERKRTRRNSSHKCATL